MSKRAQQFAADGLLTVFVGAGVSTIPPTCLPSWWGLNRAVVVALRDRIAELVGPERAEALADLITARQEASQFPPEYQAEVIVSRLREAYFPVLQVLDSEAPNATHLLIAALAKEGRVKAVITTNFDRALEVAFRESNVQPEVCSSPAHFEALAQRLDAPAASGVACPILKLHGTAEAPSTLIDTLSQRKRGFPLATAACVRHLLHSTHWLFLGYSGADLEADANYLFLKPDAAQAQGFTWLLRASEPPLSALQQTCALYGGRSEIVHGELPDWLSALARPLLKQEYPRAPQFAAEEINHLRELAKRKVAEHSSNWAQSERLDSALLVFAALLEAVGEPAAAIELVQQLHDTWPSDERRSRAFGAVLNTLGNLLSHSKQLDRALALFQQALTLFEPASDEQFHVGTLSNLALIHEQLGQTSAARDLLTRVLSFTEKKGNPAFHAIALHNLAMIQHTLGEDDAAEQLYQAELAIVQELGDEPAQAFALNNLGELAVARHRFADAMAPLQQAIAIRDRIGDDRGAAHSKANLANAHQQLQAYDAALPIYEQVLEVFRRFGDAPDVGRTLGNLARLKETTGARADALALIEQALREESAGARVRAQILQLRGEIEQKEGRNEQSLTTFTEVAEIALGMGDAKRERDAKTGQAIALKAMGDVSAAIQLLRAALANTRKYAFPGAEWVLSHLADALNQGGLARQSRGKLEPALAAFREAAELFQQASSMHNEAQCRLNAASALSRLERYGSEFSIHLNRIGALATQFLERGDVNRGLWLLEACLQLNRQAHHLADAAACLINIGSIAKATGDMERARSSLAEAVAILEPSAHPLADLATKLLREANDG